MRRARRGRCGGAPVLVVLAVLLLIGAPPALAAAPKVDVLVAVVVDEPADPATTTVAPTTVVGDEGGIGGLDTGSNTPSPRGEPAPSRTQRLADTAIFVGLLLVFAGGVAIAVWSVRRSRTST